jgi:ferric-dicitrate binding protein FerR (iron transport regulator)
LSQTTASKKIVFRGALNIASYENEKNVEVVLEEGKLIFNDKEMNKSYTMNPNDLVIYDKTLRDFSTEVVQPHKYLSWTEGKLVFRNDPLDVIARRLELWYNIDVEVNVSLTEDLRLRATFIDEGLEEVLDLLKRSLPVDYRIEDRGLKPDETFAKKKVIITLRTK